MTTDSDIIRRSLVDPGSFGELFDRHARVIHHYVWRRTDESVADDVVAETFLIAFERRARFDLERPVATPWLFGIATNLLRRRRRDEVRALRAMQQEAATGAGPTFEEDVGARVDAQRAVEQVVTALRVMPAAHRDTVLLFAWAELTYDQIAESMAVPVGTVRSRLNRARRTLRGLTGPTTAPEGETDGRDHPAPYAR